MNGLLQRVQGTVAPVIRPSRPRAYSAPAAIGGRPDQKKYDLVAGLMIRHINRNANAVIDTLRRGRSLPQAIGIMLSNMMNFSIKLAEENQQRIPPRMLFQATVETARVIGGLMIDRQLLAKNQEAEVTEQGFYIGLEQFGKRATLTDQERREYVAVMDQFVQQEQLARHG